MIVDAPWYVSNATLHAALGISFVQDVIQQRSNKHHNKMKTHSQRCYWQETTTDNLKESGHFTTSKVPRFRRWMTPHHAIEIHNISS
jgi:hypothetical protein